MMANVDVLSGTDLAHAVRPRWASALDQVERDPVRFALRASAREIGWRVYSHGGVELMQQVCGLTEEAGGSGAILDKWWDGIGGENGGAWLA
jgi:hypothetical protein